MNRFIKHSSILLGIIVLFALLSVQKANAASLQGISDTISTSRPSASAPIFVTAGANLAVGSGQTVIYDNGSYFIASDSAHLWDKGETLNSLNVASMSAAGIPAANQRTVYFTNSTTNLHHSGEPLVEEITAVHVIKFTTISSIPVNGKIIITFPTITDNILGSNLASPSATGFGFNNLQDTNISASFSSGATTCTFSHSTSNTSPSTPSITCLVQTAQINGAVTVTITIGSSTPALVNPTRSPGQACVGATTCTADYWKIGLQTQDASSVVLDTGSAKIATIDSVQVQGTVEPTLTFSITGFASGTDANSAPVTNGGCGVSILSNSGLTATATFVDLGSLGPNFLSKALQGLTVSTNGASGYALTATSSGRFINPASGMYFSDANGGNGLTNNNLPAPAVISITGLGTQTFGIHACGSRTAAVNTDQWVNAGTAPDAGSNGTAKFSNPWNTGTNNFYDTLASYSLGPVAAETTAVMYGATITSLTPPGIYRTIFTYVATATF